MNDTIKKISVILGDNEMSEHYHVKKIGIFGSCVRGEDRQDSDLDILVEFTKPVDLFQFMDLEEHIERLVGRKVDLVSNNALKPFIRENVLREVVYI